MTTVPLDLPKGVVVKGVLLREYLLEHMDQDIIEVDLPNGLTIDVGWFPEYDPRGQFRIVVYRDFRTNPVRPPIEVGSPFDVASVVKVLVDQYLGGTVFLSSAGQSEARYKLPRPTRGDYTVAATGD